MNSQLTIVQKMGANPLKIYCFNPFKGIGFLTISSTRESILNGR